MNSERGSLSLFAIVIATALFGAAGLVIDGAAGISAASRASDIAEDAARAAALAGSNPNMSGLVGVDESKAGEAAAAWLTREVIDPSDAQITVTPDIVTVVVTMRRETALLRLAGVPELTVEGVGAARPASGITKEGA
jgi:Flp pilus assembly protein TadG